MIVIQEEFSKHNIDIDISFILQLGKCCPVAECINMKVHLQLQTQLQIKTIYKKAI